VLLFSRPPRERQSTFLSTTRLFCAHPRPTVQMRSIGLISSARASEHQGSMNPAARSLYPGACSSSSSELRARERLARRCVWTPVHVATRPGVTAPTVLRLVHHLLSVPSRRSSSILADAFSSRRCRRLPRCLATVVEPRHLLESMNNRARRCPLAAACCGSEEWGRHENMIVAYRHALIT